MRVDRENRSQTLTIRLCFCLALVGCIAPSAYSQSGGGDAVITGRVVVIDSGPAVPVRRARVSLTSPTGAMVLAYTDLEGRFTTGPVSPGTYLIDAGKAGFYLPRDVSGGPAANKTSVVVPAGATVVSKDIVLERAGAIEGRVSDENGAPAPNAIVRVRAFGREGTPLVAAIQPAQSDDRGEYRLHSLPAGDYVVEMARPGPKAVPVFFPGVGAVVAARSVQVRARETTAGIDVALPSVPLPEARPASTPPSGAVDPPPSPNRIVGRITESDSRLPVARARVDVVPWNPPYTVGRTSATSDELGRFQVAVPDGSYRITVRAEGFIERTYGWREDEPRGRRVELASGRSFDKADVVLPRAGAIEGRLLDEFGDPVAGISMRLANTVFIAGMLRMDTSEGLVSVRPPTDDTGRFRIFNVPPGLYYLVALAGPFTRGGDVPGFASTFYPGTPLGRDATAVQVHSNRTTTVNEFSLRPARTADVKGIVVTPQGVPVPRANVAMSPLLDGDVRILVSATATTNADGTFAFRNVPAGTYVAQVQTSTPRSFGHTTLDVGDNAVELRVQAIPATTLSGQVIFDGSSPHPAPSDVILTFPVATDFVTSPPETSLWSPRWSDDGTFTVSNVIGRLLLRPTARPDSWVMTAMSLRGVDVTDTPIDFTRGDVKDLSITFEKIGAAVSGRVTDGDQPIDDYSMLMFAADAEKWRWPSRFVKRGQPNQEGVFSLSGLLPGEYLAVALRGVPGNAWADPKFLATIRNRATPVSVVADTSQTLTLKLVK